MNWIYAVVLLKATYGAIAILKPTRSRQWWVQAWWSPIPYGLQFRTPTLYEIFLYVLCVLQKVLTLINFTWIFNNRRPAFYTSSCGRYFYQSTSPRLINILLVAIYQFINICVDPFGARHIITTPRIIGACILTWLLPLILIGPFNWTGLDQNLLFGISWTWVRSSPIHRPLLCLHLQSNLYRSSRCQLFRRRENAKTKQFFSQFH